jgi:anti-anti-sigma regulatory factor
MRRRAVILDCSGLTGQDAAEIEWLAWLHLALRRESIELRLRNTSSSLVELIDFCGLTAVLRVEPGRETEERKEPCRIEEERQVDDLST